jgi:hypothetical protein
MALDFAIDRRENKQIMEIIPFTIPVTGLTHSKSL